MLIKKIKDISIIRKLTLAYIIFILLPSAVISGYSYYQSRESFMNDIIQKSRININQIQYNINNECSVVEGISNNISYNTRLQNFLRESFKMDADSYSEYSEYVYPLVNYAMIFQKINISEIKVFLSNKTIPEGWGIFFRESRVENNDWYREFIRSDDFAAWVGPHPPNYFSYPASEEKRPVMTYFEKIKTSDGKYLGCLAIDIICSDFFSFADDIYKQNESICILDKKNTPIYLKGSAWNNKEWTSEWINAEIDKGKAGHFEYKDNIYLYKYLEPLGISIFTAIPAVSDMRAFGAFSLTVGLLILVNLLLILIFYIVLRYVFVKMTKSIKSVNNIIKNNFAGRLPEEREDEIGQIARQFNRLIDRVNELVRDIVKKETAQRNAQLKALQFQINPHFIYNTIDIFRAKLELDGKYEVADSMAYFGKMLRYNIETKSMYTTLESEVRYSMQYISIHKLRYGERLEVGIYLPEHISEHRIIKFILQPIIENSMTHGFKGMDCKLRIDIRFEIKDGRIWVEILDNGIGINRRLLDRINYQLRYSKYDENTAESSNSIGLRNINERLKLFYGNDYYVQIERPEDRYTRTLFSIPIEKDNIKEQGDYSD